MTDKFRVVTTGWALDVIERLGKPLEAETGFEFSHILDPSLDRSALEKFGNPRFFVIRDDVRMKVPDPDRAALAALEQPGVPTIHNMILSDSLVKHVPYEEALGYATHVAQRLEDLFVQIQPAVVIGGFDRLHCSLGLAVARKLRIPWFALAFTTIPPGLAGFCTNLSPDSAISFLPWPPADLRALAERTVADFEAKRLLVPAGLSANNLAMVLRRLPGHVRSLYRAAVRPADLMVQHPPRRLAREYVRKRTNLLTLPINEMLSAPPDAPYVFFGLHLQPEAAVDVWAPFFADQFAVIEQISRSTPPTHLVLVKVHKSDADNYSRRQLARLQALPGVRLVSPYAQSRAFVEKASIVFSIQGNIALEAALLGRPVLLFGDSRFMELPSVTQVKRSTDLPAQVRTKLAAPPPDREAIVRGVMSYLSGYAPGCYNNWEATPSHPEIVAMADHFRALRDSILHSSSQPTTTAAVPIDR